MIIIRGDSCKVMAQFPNNYVDAVICDPPYGINFMSKGWDYGVPGIVYWAEALRVSKPGAYLLAFGGTRTFHRLTCAIEDARWEIRDCIMWVYGSGFPKSLDVSKAIDKELGAQREVVGIEDCPDIRRNVEQDRARGIHHGQPKYSPGTEEPRIDYERTIPASDPAKQWQGWGTALKPAWEPVIVARKPLEGTVAQNVQKWGTGAINIDGCRIEGIPPSVPQPAFNSPTGKIYGMKTGGGRNGEMSQAQGRWPANVILDGSEEVLAGFPNNNPGCKSPSSAKPKSKYRPNQGNYQPQGSIHPDDGSASRFFYCAKASRSERGEGNNHPTVKPLKLMEYLVTLVSCEGSIILDPFCGSGTTGIAAYNKHRDFIGIDSEGSYVELSTSRLLEVGAEVCMCEAE